MPARPGEQHHHAKLREQEVILLRWEPENRRHYRKLLKKVCSTTISAARSGKTWAYLNRRVRPPRHWS